MPVVHNSKSLIHGLSVSCHSNLPSTPFIECTSFENTKHVVDWNNISILPYISVCLPMIIKGVSEIHGFNKIIKNKPLRINPSYDK